LASRAGRVHFWSGAVRDALRDEAQDCVSFEQKPYDVLASQAIVDVPPLLASLDRTAFAQAGKMAARVAGREAGGLRDLARKSSPPRGASRMFNRAGSERL